MLGMLNGWEILLIAAAVLLLFGARKLPALAKSLGRSIKEFKGGFREANMEEHGKIRKAPEVVPSGSKNA
jgi:sec-independent protein translocase protein TatA